MGQNDRGQYVLVPAQTLSYPGEAAPQRISQPPVRTKTESSVCATASDSGVSEHSQRTNSSTASFVEAGKAMQYIVERRVQMRAGISPNSDSIYVLEPGHQVNVIKTQKIKTKNQFVTTKALVLLESGNQGWVSVNRHAKKTEEDFIFHGRLSAYQQKTVRTLDLWKQCDVKVLSVSNTNKNTFVVKVTSTNALWEDIEELRRNLLQNPPSVCFQESRSH